MDGVAAEYHACKDTACLSIQWKEAVHETTKNVGFRQRTPETSLCGLVYPPEFNYTSP
ncbi:MAG: hypothetical protein LBD55_08090 [Treponema sp.]|jgi:hypothetical protein|nr:hypothetical protein [Treponema sp.]